MAEKVIIDTGISLDTKEATAKLRKFSKEVDKLQGGLNKAQKIKLDTPAIKRALATAGTANLYKGRGDSGRAGNGVLSRLRGGAVRGVSEGVRTLGNGLGRLAKRLIVFGLIVKGLKEVTEWIKKVANTNDETREALGRLKGAWLTLLAPLTQAVLPAITALADRLTQIVLQIAQFTSSMFGTSLADAAASAEDLYENTKMANGQLAKFDELTVIGDYDNTSFDFANFQIQEGLFAQKLRDAILSGDWYGGGRILAEKVNEVVSNAFDPDFLAEKITDFINKGLQFAAGFFSNLNWEDFGRRIGQFIEGLLVNIDWRSFGEAIGAFQGGILTLILTAISQLDAEAVEKAFKDFFAGVFDGLDNVLPKDGPLRALFETVKSIFDGLMKAWDGTKPFRDWVENSALPKVFEVISSGLKEIGGFFDRNGEKIGGALKNLWEAIEPGIDPIFTTGLTLLEGAIKLVFDALDAGVDIVTTIINVISDLLKLDFVGAWEHLTGGLENLFNDFGAFILHGIATLIRAIDPNSVIADWLDKGAEQLREGKDAFNRYSTEIVEIDETAAEKIIEHQEDLTSEMKQVVIDAGIPDTWEGEYGEVVEDVQEKMAEALTMVIDTNWEAGGEISASRIIGGLTKRGIPEELAALAADGVLQWANADWENAGTTAGRSMAEALGDEFKKTLREYDFSDLGVGLGTLNVSSQQARNIRAYYANQIDWDAPGLASGTVVPRNHEFLARLGDNKYEPEVVSPLSTMKQAFLEAMSESGGGRTDRLLEELIDVVAGKQLVITPSSSFGRVVAQSEKMYRTVTG